MSWQSFLTEEIEVLGEIIKSDEEEQESHGTSTGTGATEIISLILYSKRTYSILHDACYQLISDSLAVNELTVHPQRHRQRLLQQREACRVMRELSRQIESSQWFPYQPSAGRRVAIVPLAGSTEVNDNESIFVSYTEGGLICAHGTL